MTLSINFHHGTRLIMLIHELIIRLTTIQPTTQLNNFE